MLTIFKSTKGQDKIAFNGYSYRKDKTSMQSVNWRCDVSKCKGRLITCIDYKNSTSEPIETGEHFHAPNPAKIAAAVALSAAKEESVQNPEVPPRRIISNAMLNLADEALVALPPRRNFRRSLQRKRTRDEAFPARPTTRDFEIPEQFHHVSIDNRDDRFLLYDSYDAMADDSDTDGGRVVIFATNEMLNLLKYNRNWMADGTFKVSPTFFLQLYTIHAILGRDNVMPCIYALLTGKTRCLYDKMWEVITNKIPGLNPTSCTTDFEIAAHQSMRHFFPGIQIWGCFFHLGQAIWRRVNDLGLRMAYIEDENLRLFTKMLAALAFLPSGHVKRAFEKLDEDRDRNGLEILAPVYSSFEDTYIGRPTRGGRGRRRPTFDPEMWNVRDRTTEGMPRTNNKLEGWHKGIQVMFQGPHPNIWKFVRCLGREQILQHGELIQIQAGEFRGKHNKHYEAVNKRLVTLITKEQEGEIDHIEFLKNISLNLELNV